MTFPYIREIAHRYRRYKGKLTERKKKKQSRPRGEIEKIGIWGVVINWSKKSKLFRCIENNEEMYVQLL